MKKNAIILLLSAIIFVAGCKVNYSFTGTNTGDAQTITIHTFPNRAPLAPPTYSQVFSESLKEDFLRQTKLDLVAQNGDLEISGSIVGYTTNPIAVTGEETTAMNRLKVTVKVKFVNHLDPTQSFEREFSKFEDYSSSLSLRDVEPVLLESITEQLIQEIIQSSLGNW